MFSVCRFSPIFSQLSRFLPFMLVGSLTGCGSGLIQVGGTVTVDGQPTEGVMLIFHPVGDDPTALPATTTSGPDGRYSLSTNMEPGIPIGSYKITATWPDPNHKAVAVGFSAPEPAPDLFKGRYSGTSSVMTTEITGAKQDLKVELTSK